MRLALALLVSAIASNSANAQSDDPTFADRLRESTKQARDLAARKAEMEARHEESERNATVHPRAEYTASANLETIRYVIGKLAAKGDDTYVLTNYVTNPSRLNRKMRKARTKNALHL